MIQEVEVNGGISKAIERLLSTKQNISNTTSLLKSPNEESISNFMFGLIEINVFTIF